MNDSRRSQDLISIHEGDSVGLERAGANFEKGSSDQSKWPAPLALFLIRLFQKQYRIQQTYGIRGPKYNH